MKVIRSENKGDPNYIKGFKTTKEQNYKRMENGEEIEIINMRELPERIVIYTADGAHAKCDNISTNRVALLKQMYEQFVQNYKELPKLKAKRFFLKTITFILSVAIPVVTVLINRMLVPVSMTGVFAASASVLTVVGFGGAKVKKISNKIEDVKKYKYYNDNSEVLKKFNLGNPNHLINVDGKYIAQIKSIVKQMPDDRSEKETIFNMNSISDIPLNVLIDLVNNIERLDCLGVTYSPNKPNKTGEERQAKVKTYDLKNQ